MYLNRLYETSFLSCCKILGVHISSVLKIHSKPSKKNYLQTLIKSCSAAIKTLYNLNKSFCGDYEEFALPT